MNEDSFIMGGESAGGVNAIVNVYDCDVHAFDMEQPDSDLAKEAAQRFCDRVGSLLQRHIRIAR